ncbi:hypothetical protein H4R99_002926 [Coemansia sp. RSA 1722]|nr:hypothetical protein IWW45_002299 [Coemansia sp. RSA 485]KAJ2601676.1 hypothetical protein H4R99_002926 [Coemansia sp. RSA 1722]
MAIAGDRRTEEYEQTAEYIRKLCEGNEDQDGDHNENLVLDSISDTLDNQLNGYSTASHMHPLLNGANMLETSLSAPQSPGVAGQMLKRTPTRSRTRATRLTKTASLAIKAASGAANGAALSAILPPGSNSKCGSANGQGHVVGEDRAHDACDACGQPGQFICCELCPRVYHFLCVNPPISAETVSKIDHWYCRQCQLVASRKRKSRAHAKNIFYPLISQMEYGNPQVFAVPEDIRRQFDGIEADIDGTFINTREDKPQRASNTSARDFSRLTDDHNETILCYRCGLSALHGPVIRCDYCPLSWHWDCLDPPLSAAPPSRKRWMCPNHADHAVRHYRRYKFRKERIVDLTALPEDARNGTVVDVVDDDPPWQQEMRDPKVRYRIPSSRIRKEFSLNAHPCRVEPLQPPGSKPLADGVDRDPHTQSVELAKAAQSQQQVLDTNVTGSSAVVAAVRDADAGAVAEWLQSIVAFQQEVARFVMALADSKDTQLGGCWPDTLAQISPDPNPKDRIALLSSVAAQLLTAEPADSAASSQREDKSEAESESATKDGFTACEAANEHNVLIDAGLSDSLSLQETAVSALEELTGQNAACVDVSGDALLDEHDNGDEEGGKRNRTMLREYGVSSSDLVDALNRLLDNWSAELVSAASVDRGQGWRELGDGRNKRKARAMSLDSSDAGCQPVSEPAKHQRLDGPDSKTMDPVNALHNGAHQEPLEPQKDDVEPASSAAKAHSLVGALLKTKGADALLSFLLSS